MSSSIDYPLNLYADDPAPLAADKNVQVVEDALSSNMGKVSAW